MNLYSSYIKPCRLQLEMMGMCLIGSLRAFMGGILQRLQIRVLNWRTSGYTVRSFKGEVNHDGQVLALKLNEKGDEVASGSQVTKLVFPSQVVSTDVNSFSSQDKTILVWSVRGGRCLRRLRGHGGGVYCLVRLFLLYQISWNNELDVRLD